MNCMENKQWVERLTEWSDSWKRSQKDVNIGKNIIREFVPFLEHLVTHGYNVKTLRKHFNNLWLLGGEIIDRLDSRDDLRRRSGKEILMIFVDSEGGPLSRHNQSEEEQRSFDSSCRKLYKFLVAETRNPRTHKTGGMTSSSTLRTSTGWRKAKRAGSHDGGPGGGP